MFFPQIIVIGYALTYFKNYICFLNPSDMKQILFALLFFTRLITCFSQVESVKTVSIVKNGAFSINK